MSHSPSATDSPPQGAKSLTIASVVGFMVVLELSSGLLQGWFNPLLGQIAQRFEVSPASLNWINLVYLLVSVVCVPVIAKLGDRFGHKRVLVAAVAAVAIGSIVVAIAPNFFVLLLGRAIQAPLACFLPLEFAIVRSRGGEKAGKGIGLLVGALTFGATLGLLLSGGLAQVMPLQGVLWVPAVLMTLCIPIVIFLVPETTERVSGSIDWLGAALLSIGLIVLLAGISNANTWGWGSLLTLGTLIGGVVILAVWVVVERRVASPLVDLHAIAATKITVPLVAAFLFGAQLFGSQTPIAVFALSNPAEAGFGLGLTPMGSGLLFMAASVAMFLGASLGDRIVGFLGHRNTIILGSALAAAAYGILAFVHDTTTAVAVALFVSGFGNGLVASVLPTIVVLRAPSDSVGIASALYNTSRTAAGAVAGAVFTLVMSMFLVTVGSGSATRSVSGEPAYVAVWLISAALCVAILLLATRIGAVHTTTPKAAADPTTNEPNAVDNTLKEAI
ncbi:MFS family permease [Paenarthrobacter sp. TE4293]|uniref:MFS transporter n=1 Tax=Paenarthrobacter sp. TE4293 TaxID=3381695 RepID=UPI003D1F3C67